MKRVSSRPMVLLVAIFTAFAAWLITAPAAAPAVTTHTPVMGPSLLSAAQLKAWYTRHSGVHPRIPIYHDDVGKLAQVFIDEGKVDGVRGDIAFVQSMLETGWLGFAGSQIPPDAYNYAGIFAFDGRSGLPNCAHGDSAPSRCMGTPQKGVSTQIELLRSYADPGAKTLKNRLISAPSDRAGQAPLWEYFGGHNCPCGKLIWASADNYGLIIIRLYSQALAESGLAGACVPYAPPSSGPTSGNGYWEVTSDYVVHALGSAHFWGDPHPGRGLPPLIGGESLTTGVGYWLVRTDGGVYRYGTAPFWGSMSGKHLNKPVNGMERTGDNKGYWLVANDGGIFGFGNAHFYGSMGGKHLNQQILGMERTASGKGYWEFAADGGIFGFGPDAKFYGSLGGKHLAYPIVAMQRTLTGKGYWMMSLDGRVFAFGDAKTYGDSAGCKNLGGATRMLVTPDGKGYWIATGTGAILPFGSAKRIGFPAKVGGYPVALMSGN